MSDAIWPTNTARAAVLDDVTLAITTALSKKTNVAGICDADHPKFSATNGEKNKARYAMVKNVLDTRLAVIINMIDP
jgi:hypothetical protein